MNYNELFSFSNLYKSYIKARKNKRHKNEVIIYETNLANNLWQLKEKLDNKTYTITKYNHFTIYEPKQRNIDAIGFEDRIVQHCLADYYLMPLLERKLIYDNAACRKNKGTDFARNRLKKFLVDYSRKYKTEDGYYLKIDFHHYFETIDHIILKDKLKNIIEDKDILNLCFNIIDSFNVTIDKGLPLGNQTSQCFALYYLDKVDRIIKEKYQIKYYCRYMDDLIVIDNSKEKLTNLYLYLKEYIKTEGLSFNEKKTQIHKIINHPISYLGFNYTLTRSKKLYIKVINEKYRSFLRHSNSILDSTLVINQYKKYLSIREKRY